MNSATVHSSRLQTAGRPRPGGAPLIVHIVHRLATGGLENGLINLINHLPEQSYRHAVVCITDATDFKRRITKKGIICREMHKAPGMHPSVYYRLWKVLRELDPSVVHTRNLGTLEYQVIAILAGVRIRIHGEHGRDASDIDGENRRYIRLRRLFKPFVTAYVTVSEDIAGRLRSKIGVSDGKIFQVYNGVDISKFHPRRVDTGSSSHTLRIGTVGRLQKEKDPLTLVRAFSELMARARSHSVELRLALIGDGPLREAVRRELAGLGIADRVWTPGERSDVAECLRGMDLFVLPSLTEGISNTILEAMATGLPVIATDVGGNPELVVHERTGLLTPAGDPRSLADAMMRYVDQPQLLALHGAAGRQRVEEKFSLDSMVRGYSSIYDRFL